MKTIDFETAGKRAGEKILQTCSNVSSGKKSFGITLKELVSEFIKWRTQDVYAGNITAGRLVTIKSRCKYILKFKELSLKISELHRSSFFDCEAWRNKTTQVTQSVTTRNEQATEFN